MKLEISGRQSGKTTRLLRELHNQLLIGKTCVLIAPTYFIVDHLARKTGVDIRLNPKLITATNVDDALKLLAGKAAWWEVEWFFEEFDMIKPEKMLFAGGLIASPNGMMSGTPTRTRSLQELMDPNTQDPLVLALRYTDGKYDRFVNNRVVKELSNQVNPSRKPELIGSFHEVVTPTFVNF